MTTSTFFLKMLSNDPKISSGRFLTMVTVLSILYAWLVVSLYTLTLQDIPAGVYTFAGLVVAGKTMGMFAEKKGDTDESSKGSD